MVCPDQVLDKAGAFLKSDPVAHNLILTLLRSRMAYPEPARYWVVEIDGRTSGVVFQSPPDFIATITPMGAEAVTAAVEGIADQGVNLPGVSGRAATVALFAGHWSERTKSPVHPVQAQRIYEAVRVALTDAVSGTLRQATSDDRDLLVEWLQAFHAEIGESVGDPAQVVPRRLRAGQLWLWDDHGPAAMAGMSDAVVGVVRVGPVYTPAARRNCGYASALVAGISSAARTRGERPILYTDLGNPTSNSIYRAIGYHAVVEVLRYRFGWVPGVLCGTVVPAAVLRPSLWRHAARLVPVLREPRGCGLPGTPDPWRVTFSRRTGTPVHLSERQLTIYGSMG